MLERLHEISKTTLEVGSTPVKNALSEKDEKITCFMKLLTDKSAELRKINNETTELRQSMSEVLTKCEKAIMGKDHIINQQKEELQNAKKKSENLLKQQETSLKLNKEMQSVIEALEEKKLKAEARAKQLKHQLFVKSRLVEQMNKKRKKTEKAVIYRCDQLRQKTDKLQEECCILRMENNDILLELKTTLQATEKILEECSKKKKSEQIVNELMKQRDTLAKQLKEVHAINKKQRDDLEIRLKEESERRKKSEIYGDSLSKACKERAKEHRTMQKQVLHMTNKIAATKHILMNTREKLRLTKIKLKDEMKLTESQKNKLEELQEDIKRKAEEIEATKKPATSVQATQTGSRENLKRLLFDVENLTMHKDALEDIVTLRNDEINKLSSNNDQLCKKLLNAEKKNKQFQAFQKEEMHLAGMRESIRLQRSQQQDMLRQLLNSTS